MSRSWPLVLLREVLRQHQEYIEAPEPRLYPKLSVKLYGKGVCLDTPADGAILRMKRHQIARKGQVILSEIWGKKGAIGFVPPEGDGALCTSHFFLFDVLQDRIEPGYLQAIFTANYLQDQLDAEAKGTTGYAAVRPNHLLAARIPLPSLEEQRRIVARIEELAAQIEEARGLREQAVEEAETLFRCIKSNCMTDALRAYGGEPLGDLLSMTSGEGLTSSQMDDSFQFPVYGGGGITGRYSRYLFEEPMIAIGRVGARCGCVFITEPKSWITDNALYLSRISDRLDKKYLVNALTNLDLRQQANQAAQPVVSQKKIKPIEIPVPPLSEQRRIVAYLDNLQANADSLERLQTETAVELDALLPSILDKAFKGKL